MTFSLAIDPPKHSANHETAKAECNDFLNNLEFYRILGSLLAIITFVSSIDQFSLSVEKAILRGCLKSIPYWDTVTEQKRGLDAGMWESAETYPTNLNNRISINK